MHLVGFIIRIYHNARSPERQTFDLINERKMGRMKIINAQQAKSTYAYKNTKQKLLKMKTAVWFNEMCRLNHLTPKYINITVIHSIGMCRMRRFLAVLRSVFHSSLLCTFSCHPSPPTILPSSPTSSCRLFLGLPLNLVVPKFIHNTLWGILFPSILCTCPNQHNLL